MLLNPQLSIEILNAWVKDQNHPRRGRDDRPLPTINEITYFVDTMFQVSLLKEEGFGINVSVAWMSKEDFLKFEIPKYRQTQLCLFFETPIEFSAKNLAKMNGIANGKTSVLIAHGNEISSYLWGICYFEKFHENLLQIPAGMDCTRHFPPDCPIITTMSTGSLEISRGDTRIGWLENGGFIAAHATVLSCKIAGKYFLKHIGVEIDETKECYKSRNDAALGGTYFSCIEYLIETLSERKQAATVVLVPNKDWAEGFFKSSWAINGSMEIDVLQKKMVEFSNSDECIFKLKVSKTLGNRLKSLVDLAKMDGALLLTPDLNVLAFGAKLKSENWNGKIEAGQIPFIKSQELIDFSKLGTRHNSAINFVGQVDDAIALVASSDGPIRLFVKDERVKTIFYWPDCRRSMF